VSATASAAATWPSKDRSIPSRSDRPHPGLSYRITVNFSASRSITLANENSSPNTRRWLTQPESSNSGGPTPDVEYATHPAGVAQYRILGPTRPG
jgi:hypothetical protein